MKQRGDIAKRGVKKKEIIIRLSPEEKSPTEVQSTRCDDRNSLVTTVTH